MPAVLLVEDVRAWAVAAQTRAKARGRAMSRNRNDAVTPASSAARQLTGLGPGASVPGGFGCGGDQADRGRRASRAPTGHAEASEDGRGHTRRGGAGHWPRPRCGPRRRSAGRRSGWRRSLLAPTLVFLLVFTYWPLVVSVLGSFQRFVGPAAAPPGSGCRNYQDLWGDALFRQVLVNTALYALVAGPLAVLFGLGAAVAVDGHRRLRLLRGHSSSTPCCCRRSPSPRRGCSS